MRIRHLLLSLGAAVALSACSTVDVHTDYDRSAAFGTYRTYTIAPGADSRDLPMYCEIALRKSVRSEMAARGVKEVSGKEADLAVVWHVALTNKTSARQIAEQREGEYWDYAFGSYTYWAGMPANLANTQPYGDGTLVLDVVDLRTETLVFRGTAVAAAMGPERGAKNIEKAVKQMVAALPTPK